jgi:hypothetical protein
MNAIARESLDTRILKWAGFALVAFLVSAFATRTPVRADVTAHAPAAQSCVAATPCT